MFIDARTLPENQTLETDVCIVGAGVAGITLAREFIDAGFRVCLLESGGLKPDKATQSLYWGENIGLPYYPLDTSRLRFWGGTSHCWVLPLGESRQGVRLRPLDPIDFEEREWLPYSGWPFDRSHLDPFYERAQAVCQIGPYAYDVETWEDPDSTPRLPLVSNRAKTTIFQFGRRDHFFGEYREQIERASNIKTILHANVVEIETNETAAVVTGVRIKTLEGKSASVSAGLYVLAMGAIEIPRLLLLSNQVQKKGLANQYDLVGRFFMEHPHLWSGIFIPSGPKVFSSTGLYEVHNASKVPIMGKLTLSEEVLRREKLLNWCASIHPGFWDIPSKGMASLKYTLGELRRAKIPDGVSSHMVNILKDLGGIGRRICRKIRPPIKPEVFRLNHMAEQVPNPESRVLLDTECDALGQPRVQLNWQVTRQDMQSMIDAQRIIDDELQRAGLGRLLIEMKDSTPPPGLHGGWHHMGTTRMHRDPRRGVVDENSRVHGLSNLYIAGPSVFPTGGCSNPVLTIVALTLRLGDHLKKYMAS